MQDDLTQDFNAKKPFLIKSNFLSVLIVLTFIYAGFLLYQVISTNYQVSRKIAYLKNQIASVKTDINDLQTLIAYYQTPAFQELEARKKLGMKMPGEKVIRVDVKETPTANNKQTEAASSAKIIPNYQLWLDFISGNY